MDHQEFLRTLEEVIEAPAGSITGSETLDSLAKWDSVAMMSLMGVVAEKSEARLSPRRMATCTTVDDIFHLIPVA
jgi:acyl carrier protein